MTTYANEDVPGEIRRVLRKVDFEAKAKHVSLPDGEYTTTWEEPAVAVAADANIITSSVYWGDGTHAPVLDFDFPCILLPSSTEGHYHLIIDQEISWEAYVKILEAMAEAGLLEPGYVAASKDRGYTSIRLPWVSKPPKKEQVDDLILD